MLTIILWKWKTDGWRRQYSSQQVNAVISMLERYLTIPHKIVCITDDSVGIKCETYPLWNEPNVQVAARQPNCYKRLKLFSKEMKHIFGERIASMDIDVIIRNNIDSILNRPEEFVIMRGRAAPYNGSMYLMKAGARSHVWDTFDPVQSPKIVRKYKTGPRARSYYGSDQSWISVVCPDEVVWTPEDGVHIYASHVDKQGIVPDNNRMLFFAGAVKPWDSSFKLRFPKLYEEYMSYLAPN